VALGQVLGKPRVVDAQGTAAFPACRWRTALVTLRLRLPLLGVFALPGLLLLDALGLCFGEGGSGA
jgi:hypothetical protein